MLLLSLSVWLFPGCDSLDVTPDLGGTEDVGGDDGNDDDGNDGNSDEDDDGLTLEEEKSLGTDPAEADSDNDGLLDGEEVEAGTNPSFEWSVPLEDGDYLVGACPELPDEENAGWTAEYTLEYGGQTYEWEGYAEGDTIVNLVGLDSFEQRISTYSFCGNYTLVSVGAMWCGPCAELADEAAELQAEVREEVANFQLVDLITQDTSGELPDDKDLDKWVKGGSLEGVVVLGGDPEESDNRNQANFAPWDADGYIPTTVLLSPTMVVISMDEDLVTASDVTRAIQKYEKSLD